MKTTYSTIATLALMGASLTGLACGGSDPTPIGTGTPVAGAGGGAAVGAGGGAAVGAGGGAVVGAGGGATVAPTGTPIFTGTGSWVNETDNTYGIQGAFFVLEDSVGTPPGGTNLTPDAFDANTAKPCVNGTVGGVLDASGAACDASVDGSCAWSQYWGGGIGFNLKETGGETSVKSAFNATAAGITGFSFVLSGDGGGGVIRFKAKMEGSEADFCAETSATGGSFTFDQLVHNCYAGGVASETLDPTKLMQLEWQLVTEAGTDFTVSNFCVESVSAI